MKYLGFGLFECNTYVAEISYGTAKGLWLNYKERNHATIH